MSFESPTVVVVSTAETIVSIDDPSHEVLVPRHTIEVLEVGAQGPAGATGATGPTGPSGAGVVEFAFAFGDATPKTLLTAPAGKTVYGAGLHIHTGFDGAGAALQIGDAGNAGRLMASGENAPGDAGSYLTAPNHRYGTPTVLLLTITPGGGASQGAGIVTLQVEQ